MLRFKVPKKPVNVKAIESRPQACKQVAKLPHPMLGLQRRVGNRAVNGIIQTMLTVNSPNDEHEREADRVAQDVVAGIGTAEPSMARFDTMDVSDIKKRQPGKPRNAPQQGSGVMAVPPAVAADIEQARGWGNPISAAVRGPLEQAFGTDFSAVRIHADDRSDDLGRSLHARAFATGRDIFFRHGEYKPNSLSGRQVLAHELTHVMQQAGVEYFGSGQTIADMRISGGAGCSDVIQRLTPTEETEIKDTLEQSGTLSQDEAKLKLKYQADPDALLLIEGITKTIRDTHKAWKPPPELSQISNISVNLKNVKNLTELGNLCKAVAKLHGISPLEMIKFAVNDPSRNLDVQKTTTEAARTDCIEQVASDFGTVRGEITTLATTVIPPQKIDPGKRVPGTYKEKQEIGPAAKHLEEIKVTGNRKRQLVLGVGNNKEPHSYSNFARDYGLWDYETWATYNRELKAFPGLLLDPSLGAEVDKLLVGEVTPGEKLIDKLHFRLRGLFPGIDGIQEKVLAALGLYCEMKQKRINIYHGFPMNSLWTCGEVATIMASDELKQKTGFYGDKDKTEYQDATALFAGLNMKNAYESKADEYHTFGEELFNHYKSEFDAAPSDPASKAAAKIKFDNSIEFIARGCFYLPYGVDHVKNEISKELLDPDPTKHWSRLKEMRKWT